MKKRIFKKTVKIFLLFMFYLKYSVVFAAENYTLLEKLPQMEGEGAPNLGQYLSGIFKLGIGVASVLAVLIIVRGGVKYMTAEATPNTIEDAKQDITNALFGLVLVLSSWILLNTINPDLVNTNLNLKSIVPIAIPETKTTQTTYQTTQTGSEECKNKCKPDPFVFDSTTKKCICTGNVPTAEIADYKTCWCNRNDCFTNKKSCPLFLGASTCYERQVPKETICK